MKRLLVKSISLSALAMVLVISLLSAAAIADCPYGTKECRNGYWWIYDKCGSEYCWIDTGQKCELSKLEILLPEQASDCGFEQQVDLHAPGLDVLKEISHAFCIVYLAAQD
jgi:hypothetical protein